MAESGSGQEKTEEPTSKKQQETKDKGQVPRSKEFNTVIMLLASGVAFLFVGENIVIDLGNIITTNFVLDRQTIFDTSSLAQLFWDSVVLGIRAVAPFFFVMVLAAILAPMTLGGVTFSVESLTPSLGKLDPIKGIKKVFGMKGWVELLKSLVKLALVGSVGYLLFLDKLPQFVALGTLSLGDALSSLGSELTWIFIILSSTLFIVALIDAPFQLWEFNQQQKMTLQEIKDENKDSEGNPELKGKIKATQREIAQRRMMEAVPNADVIITNPTHYAVALKYDQLTMAAPVIVAMGCDLVALQIRRIAAANDVTILESPALARSLYYHSELGGEVPTGLYLAVAQVLAYVYQIKYFEKYGGIGPTPMSDFDIPDDLKRDDN